MKKLMYWLEHTFSPTMNKIFKKPWLAAMSSCMQKAVPFILTGCMIYLYNVLVSFIPSLPDLSPILNFSFGIISLIIAFMMANQCMEKLNHPEYIINAGISAVCVMFMVCMPTGDSADSLSMFLGLVGPTGIAVGMIIGLAVSAIFHLWGKLHFLKESSLPDFIVGWINTVVPNMLALGLFMILIYNFEINVFDVIIAIFMPLVNFGQTLPGFILMCLIPAIFYTMGVSTWLWGAIEAPIYMAGIQANIEAAAAGQAATCVATSEAVYSLGYITMGGVCATLTLTLLMCFSKSKQLKSLGRIFLTPSIFNINEPVMFGAPVVFNPILMLPAWINAIVGSTYVYFIMKTGLLNIPTKMIESSQLPAPFSSVLVTQDFRAILWYVVLFIIYLVIWYPFFKTYEKQKIAEENNTK